MEKTYVDARFLEDMSISCEGITYKIRIESFDSNGGYAPCIILDTSSGERYYSTGYIVINNHVIITKWKKEYDYDRENWICSKDLIVSIT